MTSQNELQAMNKATLIERVIELETAAAPYTVREGSDAPPYPMLDGYAPDIRVDTLLDGAMQVAGKELAQQQADAEKSVVSAWETWTAVTDPIIAELTALTGEERDAAINLMAGRSMGARQMLTRRGFDTATADQLALYVGADSERGKSIMDANTAMLEADSAESSVDAEKGATIPDALPIAFRQLMELAMLHYGADADTRWAVSVSVAPEPQEEGSDAPMRLAATAKYGRTSTRAATPRGTSNRAEGMQVWGADQPDETVPTLQTGNWGELVTKLVEGSELANRVASGGSNVNRLDIQANATFHTGNANIIAAAIWPSNTLANGVDAVRVELQQRGGKKTRFEYVADGDKVKAYQVAGPNSAGNAFAGQRVDATAYVVQTSWDGDGAEIGKEYFAPGAYLVKV